ncbi:MAG: SUMF1/EgtB/PvdO family nonheme iron enzyme [Candidatus Binatia bacterium]
MNRRTALGVGLEKVRADTLRFFEEIDERDFAWQEHPDFSPLGWHLGHIGVTEAYWILQRCKGEPSLSPFYDFFFTPTDNPKPNRAHLPPRREILEYLHTVRTQVMAFLATVEFRAADPLLAEANIFNMVLQHEEQHLEIMTLIRQLLVADRCGEERIATASRPTENTCQGDASPAEEMVHVPAGPFLMGSNELGLTLDNERPQHEVTVGGFYVQRFPVTNEAFLQFIDQGGYRTRAWWSPEGWTWREQQHIVQPLYWRKHSNGGWSEIRGDEVAPLVGRQPVSCISWYEADAYARSLGLRLVTEVEWEKAAKTGRLARVGEVWEWTSTWFAPYGGFAPHPYEGYSVPYFDQQHRVLRGASWATQPHVRRPTFRNWYQPWVREIFAGVRCAADEKE